MVIEKSHDLESVSGYFLSQEENSYKGHVLTKLKKISGIKKSIRKKLKQVGISYVELLAVIPTNVLIEEVLLDESTALKLGEKARKYLKMGLKPADEEWERRNRLKKLTTGSKEVDGILAGGIETGSITEISGEWRTGKTQSAHQLCVNVQLPYSRGGLEGNAIYLDTEGTFRPERINQMAEALDLNHRRVLKNIILGRAYNSDHQIQLIKDSKKTIKKKNIKLIVVDSAIKYLRAEYLGRVKLPERQQKLNDHLHDLQQLTNVFEELAVVITNQVLSKPNVLYGSSTIPCGGNIMAHAATTRIFLKKGKGDQRIARVIGAPHLPEDDAIFTITDEGLRSP